MIHISKNSILIFEMTRRAFFNDDTENKEIGSVCSLVDKEVTINIAS